MKIAVVAALAVLVFAAPAEARQRSHAAHPDCNVLWPCAGVTTSARGERVARQVGFGAAVKRYRPETRQVRRRSAVHHHRVARVERRQVAVVAPAPKPKASTSLDGVVPVLAEKVREIVAACGSDIWSTVRHTFIRGTRILSQHASGTAVDVHGNPKCIYALLKGWPGGYSTDYGRVDHVHISYGGREHGARFAHGGTPRRYARAWRHRHYASAAR